MQWIHTHVHGWTYSPHNAGYIIHKVTTIIKKQLTVLAYSINHDAKE